LRPQAILTTPASQLVCGHGSPPPDQTSTSSPLKIAGNVHVAAGVCKLPLVVHVPIEHLDSGEPGALAVRVPRDGDVVGA